MTSNCFFRFVKRIITCKQKMSIKQTQPATSAPKRQSRKRKTKASEAASTETCNKRMKQDTNVQSFQQHQQYSMYSDPNTSIAPFDVTLTSLATSQPVITSTPKRVTRHQEKLWRPWLPTDHEVARYKKMLNRRHTGAQRQQQRRRAHPNHGYHGYPQSPLPQQQQVYPGNFPSPAFRTAPPATTTGYHVNPTTNHMPEKRTWSPAVQVATGYEFFKQPVKLMWPKSKAHDYMFREGQKLLKQLPFQAAIGLYDDTDSDASEQNEAFMTSHTFAMNKNFVNNLAVVQN
uniref:Uncharacterized protein LOC108949545 n=1 Tax=Phallusia mammillata TaxID=59560 RepID=A0A6F9DJU6_9ASCI|nr:uncharacterized protein LOC108949545 [Phallusia mammillata]